MKKMKLISAVLAMLFAFTALGLPVLAADPPAIESYPITEYQSMQAKIDTMKLKYEDKEAGYSLYFDEQSGEMALHNLKTDEYIFSNPYDIGVNTESTDKDKKENDTIRQALLSQIILQYQDSYTGTTAVMRSYTDAALAGGQITFKDLANGVRVEYALGTVDMKRLIPQWIEKSRFESQILSVLDEHVSEFTPEEALIYKAFKSIDKNTSTPYGIVGPADKDAVYDPQSTPSPERAQSYRFLVENEGAQMYVLQGVGERMKKNIERLIRKYVKSYTYDKLEEDHELTGYEGDEREPPLFRLAVEYTIDESGLKVSIPAKSIRYNETNYTLENIVLLPYFGCTTLKESGLAIEGDGVITRNGGYIFIPDGSGTLLSYYNSDGTKLKGTQGSSMYGYDFSIEKIDATNSNAEIFRIPVFGLTEYYETTKSVSRGDYLPICTPKQVVTERKRGFVSIIEEGESFASIRANLRQMGWSGAAGDTEYSTVYALFSVKQADSVEVGSSIGDTKSSMSATVDTKYTGNYTIRYVMLSDPEIAKAKNVDYYDPSYVGMADAYRDILIKNGAIERLTQGEVEGSLPLYIRSFGSLDAKDTFLSFPVTVKKPLTTFDDVITMSEELKEAGITNVNFILEGFANGNMSKPYYPNYVKWNSTVGGKRGLNRLMDYAASSGIGVFPEFDFASVAFRKNGFTLRKYAAETMSGRYPQKREYDYVRQVMDRIGMRNIVSTGSYAKLFAKFAKQYDKYDIDALSVMSLGTDLNSDFNKDYPITRENSKLNTAELLATMKEKYSKVLVEGGNAYTLPYVTDIVGVSLDNSRYQISSASVPFIGMVLHGHMNYAGNVINTEGDVKYEILKSLENGAALYFLLSYQNTSEIKEAEMMGLSKNYSVAYETWKDDVIRYYKMLNDAVKQLQTATITDHQFVTAYRANTKTAGFLFAQQSMTLASSKAADKTLDDIIAEVDALRFDSKEKEAQWLRDGHPEDPSDPVNERYETKRRKEANTWNERLDLANAMTDKNTVDNVVSVTYTETNGKNTVFFINYNSFDVAVEYNGGVFILGAESFINAADIKSESLAGMKYEALTALQPTKGQMSNYDTAKAAYDEAVASGNATLISRAKSALERAISAITKTTVHVVKLTAVDGSVCYINYTDSNALVKLTDTEYLAVNAGSYMIK